MRTVCVCCVLCIHVFPLKPSIPLSPWLERDPVAAYPEGKSWRWQAPPRVRKADDRRAQASWFREEERRDCVCLVMMDRTVRRLWGVRRMW